MNAIPHDCRLPREVLLLSSFPVHVVPLLVKPGEAKEDLRNIDMYLKTLVSDMVSRLGDGCRKALWEYLSAQSFSLASLCAGSDSPRLVLEAISSVAADSGISTSMKHALSAELNASSAPSSQMGARSLGICTVSWRKLRMSMPTARLRRKLRRRTRLTSTL